MNPIRRLAELFTGRGQEPTRRRVRYGLSLDEFRADPSNVASMSAFLGSRVGQSVLGVLHHHRPRGYPLRGQANIEDAAMEHMRSEGHEGAIGLLVAMGASIKEESGNIPIEWGVSDVQQEEDNQEV